MNDIAEILRRLANVVRLGTVDSIQMDPPRVRIATGGLVTTWIPWLTLRAGSAVTWWPPTIGEQVIVLAANGELTTAVALLGLYGEAAPAPSDSNTANITRYPDGAQVSYDPASSTGDFTGVADLHIDASGTLHIDATRVILNADVVINGSVTQGGGAMTSNGIVVHTHQHGGVKSGGDTSGGPV
ncbi:MULTISPECIES: phage baseplate assembly protein V [unclassified Serratia (in: enterobacteria)]|uniref:phage baseplate assembly protein V n=1 Tax=unclassified Serratia (in: enterobacteria) TaxID=2647522 RepID=UPI00307635F2